MSDPPRTLCRIPIWSGARQSRGLSPATASCASLRTRASRVSAAGTWCRGTAPVGPRPLLAAPLSVSTGCSSAPAGHLRRATRATQRLHRARGVRLGQHLVLCLRHRGDHARAGSGRRGRADAHDADHDRHRPRARNRRHQLSADDPRLSERRRFVHRCQRQPWATWQGSPPPARC